MSPTERALVVLAGLLLSWTSSAMAGGDVQVTLEVPRSEVVVGEALPVKTTLRNTGQDAVSLRRTEVASYELDGGPELGRVPASQEGYGTWLLHGDMPGPPVDEPEVLAAGASITLKDDVTRYALPGEAGPGTYRLFARALDGESAPSRVVVAPLAPAAPPSVLACPLKRTTTTVVVHRPGAGPAWLFTGESFDDDPSNVVLSRRLEVAPTTESVAIAVHSAPGLEGRWIAWLEGDDLRAARAWAVAFFPRVERTPTGLRDARLAPVGLQRADGTELIVVGADPAGRAAARRITVGPSGATLGDIIPLGAGPAPRRLLASWSKAGVATLVEAEGHVARAWRLDGGQAEAAVLFDRPGASILATSIAPLADDVSLYAVLAGEEGAVTLVRAGVAGPAGGLADRQPPADVTIGRPADDVRAWGVSESGLCGTPVVAITKDGAFTTAGAAGGWAALALPHGVRDLRVVDAGLAGVWAVGHEPGRGLRRALVAANPKAPPRR